MEPINLVTSPNYIHFSIVPEQWNQITRMKQVPLRTLKSHLGRESLSPYDDGPSTRIPRNMIYAGLICSQLQRNDEEERGKPIGPISSVIGTSQDLFRKQTNVFSRVKSF